MPLQQKYNNRITTYRRRDRDKKLKQIQKETRKEIKKHEKKLMSDLDNKVVDALENYTNKYLEIEKEHKNKFKYKR